MSLQGAIEEKIRAAFAPIHLEVVNESHKHNVPRDSETHFKVLVVSELFEGKKIMEQHRMVNNVLEEEFTNGLHALALSTKTPAKWNASSGVLHESPPCLGGSKA
jgi:BolA protein